MSLTLIAKCIISSVYLKEILQHVLVQELLCLFTIKRDRSDYVGAREG